MNCSTIMDKHAPMIRQTTNVRPRQPRRTDDLQSTRRDVRRAERKWRQTRLVVHRQTYTDVRDAFKKASPPLSRRITVARSSRLLTMLGRCFVLLVTWWAAHDYHWHRTVTTVPLIWRDVFRHTTWLRLFKYILILRWHLCRRILHYWPTTTSVRLQSR